MVVVVVVVLQGRGAAGTQLCQSAAGGRELRAEVGHLVSGRLDGPINPLSQLFVVFHHFKDFPLRTKSTQSSMVSSGTFEGLKLRLFPLPFNPLLLHQFFSSHSLVCTYEIKATTLAPLLLLTSTELMCTCYCTENNICVAAGQRRRGGRKTR